MPTDLTTPRDKPREYRAPLTLFNFHHNHSMFRGVCGPTGSGKSVSMIMELAVRARQQEPDSTGTRRTKWLVVRNTYPSLTQTTLSTWRTWMPQAPVVTSPTIHWHWKQKKAWPDGTGVDMWVDFLAVDDPRTDIAKLRSFDYTGAWVNEAQEIQDRLIIEWIINRRGRYPDPQTAPITWSGVIADANAMSTTHWWYKWAEVVTPVGYKFWHQPPALLRVEKNVPGARQDGQGQWWVINPLCENIPGQALGARYWLDQVPGKDTAWIKLNLCAEYGASLFGKLVWPEFDPVRHIAPKPLEPLGGYPLQIGYDTGLTPTFVITQITEPGQYRVLDEVCLTNMGMRQAVRDALKPMLSAKYPGWPVFAVGDPAGNRRADSDESTAADEIRAQGIDVKECPTNIFKPRRDAVAAFMLKRVRSTITGETSAEGFEVSPTCTMLLEALREGYVFGRVLIQGREGYKEEPVKNEWSHVCVAKGTLIRTNRGEIPIEYVTPRDWVLTPVGIRRVLAQGCTAVDAEVMELITAEGSTLVATPGHNIATNEGWKPLDTLQYSDILHCIKTTKERDTCGRPSIPSRCSTESLTTTSEKDTIKRTSCPCGPLGTCTEMFGCFIAAPYQKGTTSTIAMGTRQTIASRILNVCRSLCIMAGTCASATRSILRRFMPHWSWLVKPQKSGIDLQKGASGTVNTEKKCSRKESNESTFASFAEENTRPIQKRESVVFVPCSVNSRPAMLAVLITKNGDVAYVTYRSPPTNTDPNSHAVGIAQLRRLTERRDVYNLTVEEAHCYYANGILVKNCDALQYPATLYDRPKLGQQEMDRRFNMNGNPIELGFDPGFPMI